MCTITGITCLMESRYPNAKARMPHSDGFITLASALRRLAKMVEIPHQVLKVLTNAMRESAFHQDGGWTQAIRVSKCARFLLV